MLATLPYPEPDALVRAVQSRDEKINDYITVRIYTPEVAKGAETSDGSHGKLPIGVYYHAGGFLLGNLDTDDALCRFVAAHAECIIVSVDYRLGPKFKLPVMIEDGIDAFHWVSR